MHIANTYKNKHWFIQIGQARELLRKNLQKRHFLQLKASILKGR